MTQTQEEDVQALLRMRWYLNEGSPGDIHDIMGDEDSEGVMAEKRRLVCTDQDLTMSDITNNYSPKEMLHPFLSILSTIQQTVKFYCKICRLFISSQTSPKSKLKVYSQLFKKFSISSENFTKSLGFLEDRLNEYFTKYFPNFPGFPKFTFWRMLLRIWIRDVFDPVEAELNQICLGYIESIRQKNFETAVKNEKQEEEVKK